MQKITPHLWFDTQAREAAEFYVSLIPGSAVTHVNTIRNTPSGDCDIVTFHLAGQPFMCISAGPLFKFNPSISFHINCETPEEVDSIWERLSPGGNILMPLDRYFFSERYGFIADRYGLSWQVIHSPQSDQKITPALMFTGNAAGKAEEAINFYASVFGDASAQVLSRYDAGEEPDTAGSVRFARFTLRGQEFGATDSAYPHGFGFNEAISFMLPCDTQEEIDYFWSKLSARPESEQCGWCKDKYGVSWQVTASVLGKLMAGDPERAKRVTQAFLKMKKFNIAELERAAEG